MERQEGSRAAGPGAAGARAVAEFGREVCAEAEPGGGEGGQVPGPCKVGAALPRGERAAPGGLEGKPGLRRAPCGSGVETRGAPAGCVPGPRLPSAGSSSSASGLSCTSQTPSSPLGRPAGSTGSSFPGSAGSRDGKVGWSAGPAGSRGRGAQGCAGRARPTHPRVLQHLLDPPVAVGDAVPQPELRGEEDHGAPGRPPGSVPPAPRGPNTSGSPSRRGLPGRRACALGPAVAPLSCACSCPRSTRGLPDVGVEWKGYDGGSSTQSGESVCQDRCRPPRGGPGSHAGSYGTVPACCPVGSQEEPRTGTSTGAQHTGLGAGEWMPANTGYLSGW